MTYRFQVKTPQDFCICRVPTDLHATNGDKVPVFGGAKFANKASDFFPFDFRSEDVYDDCVELRKV